MVRRKRTRKRRSYSPRFRRFRRRVKQPLPLLPVVGGIVAPFSDSFNRAGGIAQLQADPLKFGQGLVDQITQHYAGVSVFPELSGVTGLNTAYLFNTYGGLLAGVLGHKLASKMGVNRYMRRVPFIGRWIQL